MNSCNFIGNIGKDGEVRFTANNKKVLTFTLAVQSGYGDKQVTTWINCNYWTDRAENLQQYIVKGSRIGVTGELTNRPYDSNGTQRYSLELRVIDLTLLNNKGDTKTAPQENNAPQSNAQQDQSAGTTSFDDFDDGIPFMNPYKFNWRMV